MTECNALAIDYLCPRCQSTARPVLQMQGLLTYEFDGERWLLKNVEPKGLGFVMCETCAFGKFATPTAPLQTFEETKCNSSS